MYSTAKTAARRTYPWTKYRCNNSAALVSLNDVIIQAGKEAPNDKRRTATAFFKPV